VFIQAHKAGKAQSGLEQRPPMPDVFLTMTRQKLISRRPASFRVLRAFGGSISGRGGGSAKSIIFFEEISNGRRVVAQVV
jgi:hypothetical protein